MKEKKIQKIQVEKRNILSNLFGMRRKGKNMKEEELNFKGKSGVKILNEMGSGAFLEEEEEDEQDNKDKNKDKDKGKGEKKLVSLNKIIESTLEN